jgi:hypothetical protein
VGLSLRSALDRIEVAKRLACIGAEAGRHHQQLVVEARDHPVGGGAQRLGEPAQVAGIADARAFLALAARFPVEIDEALPLAPGAMRRSGARRKAAKVETAV